MMIPESLSEALHKLDVFEAPGNAPGKPTVLVSLLGVVTVLDDYFSSVAVPSESAPVIPSGSQAANSDAAPETATSAATMMADDWRAPNLNNESGRK